MKPKEYHTIKLTSNEYDALRMLVINRWPDFIVKSMVDDGVITRVLKKVDDAGVPDEK